MFAPKVVKPPTKTIVTSTNSLARQRQAFLAHPPSQDGLDQAHMLQRSIGNQATLRLLAQRGFSPTGEKVGGDHEQEAHTASPAVQAAKPGLSWDFSEIPIFPPERTNRPHAPSSLTPHPQPGIQRKLVVGQVNDPREHEADRVADQVMRMPELTPHEIAAAEHREAQAEKQAEHDVAVSLSDEDRTKGRFGGGATLSFTATLPQISRKCAACEEEEGQMVRSKRAGSAESAAGEVPPIVHEVLRSPGQPLDSGARAFFEPRFDRDFSHIRVHTDERAAASAREAKALAYTFGPHIAFARDQYEPKTEVGRRLLAHELAHSLQQQAAGNVMQRQSDDKVQDDQVGQDQTETPAGPQPPAGPQGPQNELGGRACVIQEQIPIITVPVAVFDDEVIMQTDVDIKWKDDEIKAPLLSFCACQCGEYRQFVKGHVIRNGIKLDLPLAWGAKLEETVWHEDGDPAAGLVPGHRDRPETKVDVFDQPNRKEGCHYHGKDQPTVPGRRGDIIDVDLKFKGQTYDTCLDSWGQIHEWSFTYKGPLGGI